MALALSTPESSPLPSAANVESTVPLEDPTPPVKEKKQKEEGPQVDNDGIIDLGCSNRSSIIRLANWAQDVINRKLPIPRSPFCVWAAARVTSVDKQDLTIFISARKGKGKSYTALYLARRLAEEIALALKAIGYKIIEKGVEREPKPEDFFTIENCALLMDSSKITHLLATKGRYQVIIIDDAGVGANNREFLSRGNINFNKIMMTCRTKRWIVIFTSVLKSHVDLNIREMSDVLITIYKSYHKGGFNICKAKSSEVMELANNKNLTISRRLTFGEKEKQIDFWVSFAPDKKIAEAYDSERDVAADRILQESAVNPDEKKKAEAEEKRKAKEEKQKEKDNQLSKRETKEQEIFTKHYDTVKKMFEEDPGVKLNEIYRKCPGVTPTYLNKMRAQGGF